MCDLSDSDRSGDDLTEGEEQLSPLESRFVDLVAGGATLAEAAKATSKSERTLRRWRTRPEIASAIRARTQEQMALARATLASAANRAARELDRLAVKAKPDAARISACKAVIENATKLGELEDIEARIAELENRLGR